MDAITSKLLACPDDLGALRLADRGAQCTICGRVFMARDGVLDLLPSVDPGSPQWQLREDYNATFSQRPDRPWLQPVRAVIAGLGNAYLYSWAASRIEQLAGGRSLSMLDAACGDGMLRRRIPERHHYVGVDFSTRSLIRAARAHPDSYFRGDLTQLPFADASFDLAVSLQSLQYLDHPEEALRQIARVLKPGGHFLLSVPNKNSFKYRLQGLPAIQLQRFHRENVVSLLSAHFHTQEIATRGLWLPIPKIGIHLAGKYPESTALSWTALSIRLDAD